MNKMKTISKCGNVVDSMKHEDIAHNSLEDKYNKDIEANIEHHKNIDVEWSLKTLVIGMTP